MLKLGFYEILIILGILLLCLLVLAGIVILIIYLVRRDRTGRDAPPPGL